MPERVHTTVKFDGPALEGRSMDVNHLAPALLSLSDVLKATNSLANGNRAGVKILVNADLKQNCFELDIELALTVWEKAKQLVADKDIASAKQIAEWVGIIAPVGAGLYGLLQLIKKLRGKTVESATEVKIEDDSLGVEIRVEGESIESRKLL